MLATEEALRDTKAKIILLKREARKAPSLDDQAEIQEQIKSLEKLQRKQRQQIFDVEDEIMEKRDELIDALQEQLKQTSDITHLFTIRWHVE